MLRLTTTFVAVTALISVSAYAQDLTDSAPSQSLLAIANAPLPTAHTLAPIAIATPTSMTFRLVPDIVCPDTAATQIRAIYTKNRAIFDECTRSATYQIFPYSGTQPTAAQVYAMAIAPPCTAIFSAVIAAGFPACDMSGMPLRAAVETLLKIKDDVDDGREPASAQRFQDLLAWRRDVNLAQAAGLPCDSDSVLYSEYKESLRKTLSSSTVRVTSDLGIEYQLADGTYTRGRSGSLTFSTLLPINSSSSSSDHSAVATVRPAGGGLITNSERTMDSMASTATSHNSSIVHVATQSDALYCRHAITFVLAIAGAIAALLIG